MTFLVSGIKLHVFHKYCTYYGHFLLVTFKKQILYMHGYKRYLINNLRINTVGLLSDTTV